jgi:HlyD family secretion protein
MKILFSKKMLLALIIIALVAASLYLYPKLKQPEKIDVLVSGNGRIEATQVDITAKIPGRVSEIYVKEGDITEKGQLLALLDDRELTARMNQAEAQTRQAEENMNYARAQLKLKESELSLALKNYERAKNLYVNKNISLLQLQQAETASDSAKAVAEAAKAGIVQAQAAVESAKAQEDAVRVNLEDCKLTSPVRGRVQYRLAEPGEVVGAGGKVLVLIDPTDVYMTIFLPTAQTGLINLGSEAKIVLDAIPGTAIPAKVTFISPEAQFTPKEIETASEREKLVFRVKVTIDENLLEKHIEQVKTGLPGVAYIRLDESAPWPENLKILSE